MRKGKLASCETLPDEIAEKTMWTTCQWIPDELVEIPFSRVDLVYFVTPDNKFNTGHIEAWFRCPCGDSVEITAIPELAKEAIDARCQEHVVRAYSFEEQL